jgi:cytochrome c peroxidase
MRIIFLGLAMLLGVQLLDAPIAIPLGLDAYVPVPQDNPLTTGGVEQGRRLFFDRRLSQDESVSCASCHDPELAFSDGRAIAVGVFGRRGRRSAPAIINRGYGRSFFWDARTESLEEQVLKPIEDPNEMSLPLAEAEARVGRPSREIAKALASYVRSILSGDSRFDRFVNGDRGALSAPEQRGLEVFRGRARCVTCHVGPNFTDEKLHNTGIAWNGERLTDDGAGRGDFKTPTLRDVALTAPYMHDGSLASLDEVIDFYNRGGRSNPNLDPDIHPLNLGADERQGLAAFLIALRGTVTQK